MTVIGNKSVGTEPERNGRTDLTKQRIDRAIAKQNGKCRDNCNCCALRALRDGAPDEGAGVERDAARYRWLRDAGAAIAELGAVRFKRNKWLDAAIDAAIQGDGAGKAHD